MRASRGLSVLIVAACTACGGGGKDPAAVTFTAVHRDATPAPGVHVRVSDSAGAQERVTGVDGTASFPGVHAPYTLTYVDGCQGNAVIGPYTYVRTVAGARVAEPRAQVEQGTCTTSWSSSASATFSGRLLAFDTAVAASEVYFDLPFLWIHLDSNPMAPAGSYVAHATWPATSDLAVTLRVIEYEQDLAGNPTRFLGYWTRALTLADGDDLSGIDLARTEAIAAADVSMPVSNPAALPYRSSAAFLEWADGSIAIPVALPSDGIASLELPQIPDLESYSFEVMAASTTTADLSGCIRQVVPGVPAGACALPASSALVAPPDGATLGAATDFAWTPPEAGSVSLLELDCSWDANGKTNGLSMTVATLGAATRIPDATSLGAPAIPSGAACSWRVWWEGFGPVDVALGGPASGPLDPWRWSGSASRSLAP